MNTDDVVIVAAARTPQGRLKGQLASLSAVQLGSAAIKAAVELMFKVEVASVQTINQMGKTKRFGRSMGRRDHVKKAYVCLKPGQELNFSGEAA